MLSNFDLTNIPESDTAASESFSYIKATAFVFAALLVALCAIVVVNLTK
jgi:hypothetical protein